MLTMSRVETLIFGVIGAAFFDWLQLPLPFLFGPMMFCLVAALAKRPLQGFGQISVAARTILGIAVGASITPEVVSRIPEMAGSVVFIPFYIATIALIGVPFFHRVCGFDEVTSYYAAMPGGLQDMVIFGVLIFASSMKVNLSELRIVSPKKTLLFTFEILYFLYLPPYFQIEKLFVEIS